LTFPLFLQSSLIRKGGPVAAYCMIVSVAIYWAQNQRMKVNEVYEYQQQHTRRKQEEINVDELLQV